MKLITKDGKSIPSNNFVIVEQPKYKALERRKPGRPLKVKFTGEMQYMVYHLETPGVLDDGATFQDYFLTLEEVKEKYPDVEIVKWKDVQNHGGYSL